ncbi:MAG: hypothetical protein LBR11_12165 [Deltaproteobacteria bacterium]|nr:hypothetical protein [Deltaproteobacteria bacterium]
MGLVFSGQAEAGAVKGSQNSLVNLVKAARVSQATLAGDTSDFQMIALRDRGNDRHDRRDSHNHR